MRAGLIAITHILLTYKHYMKFSTSSPHKMCTKYILLHNVHTFFKEKELISSGYEDLLGCFLTSSPPQYVKGIPCVASALCVD